MKYAAHRVRCLIGGKSFDLGIGPPPATILKCNECSGLQASTGWINWRGCTSHSRDLEGRGSTCYLLLARGWRASPPVLHPHPSSALYPPASSCPSQVLVQARIVYRRTIRHRKRKYPMSLQRTKPLSMPWELRTRLCKNLRRMLRERDNYRLQIDQAYGRAISKKDQWQCPDRDLNRRSWRHR